MPLKKDATLLSFYICIYSYIWNIYIIPIITRAAIIDGLLKIKNAHAKNNNFSSTLLNTLNFIKLWFFSEKTGLINIRNIHANKQILQLWYWIPCILSQFKLRLKKRSSAFLTSSSYAKIIIPAQLSYSITYVLSQCIPCSIPSTPGQGNQFVSLHSLTICWSASNLWLINK